MPAGISFSLWKISECMRPMRRTTGVLFQKPSRVQSHTFAPAGWLMAMGAGLSFSYTSPCIRVSNSTFSSLGGDSIRALCGSMFLFSVPTFSVIFQSQRLEHRMQRKIHHSHTCTTSDVRSIGHGVLCTHFQLGIVEVDVIFPTTIDLQFDRCLLDDDGERTKLFNNLPLDCRLENCRFNKIQDRTDCHHSALQWADLSSDG